MSSSENKSIVSNDDAASHLSTPKQNNKKTYNDDGTLQLDEVEIPTKPLSAYAGVCALCMLIAFGGMIFGFDTGSISGFVNMPDFIRRFGSYNKSTGEHYFTDVRTGLMVSIFNVGCAVGGIVLGKLADMWGRKMALLAVTCIYIVGIVIQISSNTAWYQYFIGRIVSGLGVGGISILCPMLIGETSPKHLRGAMVACYQLMITLGIFLGYCINYGTKNRSGSSSWRITLGLSFLWGLLMMSGLSLVPESARYLAEKGRIEEAKQSLSIINKVPTDDAGLIAELDIILANVEAEALAGEATWSELFQTRTKVFQRLVMGVMIQSLQQLTGDNYFFYYGTTVFKAIGLKDSFQTSIIIGVVNFFSTFIGIYVVGLFGRRKLLISGATLMTICLCIFASVGVKSLYPNGRSEAASKSSGDVMIVFTCLYILFFATTWAPLAYVVVSESYPLRVKAKCMAIASASNWLWGFLISFFTPFISSAIHFAYGYVFMGCCVFMVFYVFFFVPETKGLSLEEVNDLWLEGVLPWKSSQWVPPSKRRADYNADDLRTDDRKGLRKFF